MLLPQSSTAQPPSSAPKPARRYTLIFPVHIECAELDASEIQNLDARRHLIEQREVDPRLVLDLRDTPSGGNTTVARAIVGWFVTGPRGYQIHNRTDEERETGIPRQWVEQVLPCGDMYRPNLAMVIVGRWTGNMGEGIAVGFAALGAEVSGTRMAGLKGSVEDLRAGGANLSIKLPTERLFATSGLPREEFVPQPLGDGRLVAGSC